MSLLDVRGVSKAYGGIQALNACALSAEQGKITGLLGPNGSGKTTLFNIITGYERADAGTVTFDGAAITSAAPNVVFGLGIGRTFQISRIAVDPLRPDTVLVAAMGSPWQDSPDRGVYRTTDGGATWQKVLYTGPSVGISDLALDPRNPEIVFAATYRFRRTPGATPTAVLRTPSTNRSTAAAPGSA